MPLGIVSFFRQPSEARPGLLLLAADVERGGAVAVDVAAALAGAGHRIVLCDLSLSEPALHRVLGLPNDEGMTDLFEFGASLRRVTTPVPDGGFFFAPAGVGVSDPERIAGHPRWDRLLAGARDAGATLLLYAPAHLPGVDRMARRVGAAAVIGPEAAADAVAEGLPEGCSLVDRIPAGRAAEEAAAAGGAAVEEPTLPEEPTFAEEPTFPEEPTLPEERATPVEPAAGTGRRDGPVEDPLAGFRPFDDDDVIAPDRGPGTGTVDADRSTPPAFSEDPTDDPFDATAATDDAFHAATATEDAPGPGIGAAPVTDDAPAPEAGGPPPPAVPAESRRESAAITTPPADVADAFRGEPTREAPTAPDEDARVDRTLDPRDAPDAVAAAGDLLSPAEALADAEGRGHDRPAGPAPLARTWLWVALGLVVVLLLLALIFLRPPANAEPTEPASPPAEPAVSESAIPAEPADGEFVPLGYTVAIEAHTNLDTARIRLARLRRMEAAMPFLITPYPLDDDVVVYRLMAGPYADSAEAVVVRDILYDDGRKPTVSEWDVRPTAFGYLIDEAETMEGARDRARELTDAGIPAYTVSIAPDGAARIYAGAFSLREQATVLAGPLSELGLDPPLVRISGWIPSP